MRSPKPDPHGDRPVANAAGPFDGSLETDEDIDLARYTQQICSVDNFRHMFALLQGEQSRGQPPTPQAAAVSRPYVMGIMLLYIRPR